MHGSEKEIWKTVEMPVKCTNTTRYEVSNLGRIRSFNNISDGNILKGSMVDGYPIIRLRLFRPAGDPELEEEIKDLKEKIAYFYEKRRRLKRQQEPKLSIRRATTSIKKREEELKKLRARNLKKRTIHQHFLFHRLVANYFLPAPKPEETIVAHLDYDKTNNNVRNLKWMTPEENHIHRERSPNVIAEKRTRKYQYRHHRKRGGKLNSTQVLHIKKLLKRGWTLKKIGKKFGVSDMQIHRIKTGENWGHVKLAEYKNPNDEEHEDA